MEKFLQDFSMKHKNIIVELVHNITDSYDSGKDLSKWSAEFKELIQPVMETNILCVMISLLNLLLDHNLSWILVIPQSDLDKSMHFFQHYYSR